MKKQLLLNQLKPSGRVFSLFVGLLVLAAVLLPQSARAGGYSTSGTPQQQAGGAADTYTWAVEGLRTSWVITPGASLDQGPAFSYGTTSTGETGATSGDDVTVTATVNGTVTFTGLTGLSGVTDEYLTDVYISGVEDFEEGQIVVKVLNHESGQEVTTLTYDGYGTFSVGQQTQIVWNDSYELEIDFTDCNQAFSQIIVNTIAASELYVYMSSEPLVDDEGLGLSIRGECPEGTRYFYSIDYVDPSLQDVTDEEYVVNLEQETLVPLLGPCTVTAYAQYGNLTSEVITGKLFGFAENPLTVVNQGIQNQVITIPDVVPALGNDVTLASVPTISSNDPAASLHYNEDNGSLVVDGNGTSILTYGLENENSENENFNILNTYDAEYKSYTVELEVVVRAPEAYGITVNGTEITETNRTDVLHDQGSVKYDGRSRLVLNNASLSSIVVGSENELPTDGLEVYLIGDNTISNADGYAIKGQSEAASIPLTFLTGSDAPGTLTYTSTGEDDLTDVSSVFPGLSLTCQNNLVAAVDGKTLTVRIPLQTIVVTENVETTVTFTEDPGVSTPGASLDNTMSSDNTVLYTLNDDGTQGSADGYDQSSNVIVVNTTMTDEDVANTDGKTPGTADYASSFTGLTFMLPAGQGVITLNVHTEPGFAFHVKIGPQDPVEVFNNDGYADKEIPFAVTAVTYVKVYLVQLSSSAPALGNHRVGPKATVSGGIGGMKVSSSKIEEAPDPAEEYLLMSDSDKSSDGKSGIRVTNANVTDLPDNAFGTAAVSYIDLSATKITGKAFTRASGAFNGVPASTLIYLPAGNVTTGPNFIVGGVCEDMRIDALSVGTFEVPRPFTASKAFFNRPFAAGTDKCYTVFLPYALSTDDVDGEFFTCGSYNASTGTVNMTAVTAENLEAHTPYIFKPASDGALKAVTNVAVTVPGAGTVSDPAAASESEGLHGVYDYYEWTTAPDNVYCFAAADKDGIQAGHFAKVGTGTHIKPFRAYMRIASATAPQYIAINWGGNVTSIVPLDRQQVRQDADGWYTITGFRLPNRPTEKGIYIHNSKKIVVK